MRKMMMILFFALAGSQGKIYAQEPAIIISDKTGWHKIGQMKVDFQRDRDEITVMGADRFSQIRFKVEDAPIDLLSLTIHFESGDPQVVELNSSVKAPGESRTIDLIGGERSLKKIVFVYKTIANYKGKKANVEIWGLKTNPDKK